MFNRIRITADAKRADHRTGGANARRFGFLPAFLDFATMRIYSSRFADGTLAPIHVLDGLPVEVVVDRLPSGRVVRAKSTLIGGFERGGLFYTRSAAERACKEWGLPPR